MLASKLEKWDLRYLFLAEEFSLWSKDPSTKCGAVIVRLDNTVCSVGFNGFPRGLLDDSRLQKREEKYSLIVHAEMNALLSSRESLLGYAMYVWPQLPCSNCAKHIIQTGISRIFTKKLNNDSWKEDAEISRGMLLATNTQLNEVEWDL